jgi:hypothetical protein
MGEIVAKMISLRCYCLILCYDAYENISVLRSEDGK